MTRASEGELLPAQLVNQLTSEVVPDTLRGWVKRAAIDQPNPTPQLPGTRPAGRVRASPLPSDHTRAAAAAGKLALHGTRGGFQSDQGRNSDRAVPTAAPDFVDFRKAIGCHVLHNDYGPYTTSATSPGLGARFHDHQLTPPPKIPWS
jgi:hypothetical protein